MEKILFIIKESTVLSPSQQPSYVFTPPQPTIESNGGFFDLSSKVSPSILLIIIILAIIFFVSGLLHLLVRFLLRPPNRDPDDLESVTALQGQLQQLFHLHDAGVDQSFIETLPVFNYKAIIGLKDPFDCAVCLCEFEAEDKLRLLPKCSHAFHMDCIDTWLLSHSTCPLCRASLLSDFSSNNTCPPVVFVLESGSESSREIINDRDCNFGRTSSVLTANSHLGSQRDFELGSTNVDYLQKSGEALSNKDEPDLTAVVESGEKVVPVKLGKFRNVDIGEGCSTNSVDSRRCYSMGSFEYVMDENSALQVPIRTPMKKQSSKKPSLPLTPGHRPAMSECDCESRRELSGFEGLFRNGNTEVNNNNSGTNSNSIVRNKRESFSISKIWLRSKNEKQKTAEDSSRRAASFRFPLSKNVVAEDDLKVKNNVNGSSRRTNSEIGSEGGWCDVENHGSCNISLDSQPKTPSFARRTLNWIVGKQNKFVHSSSVTPED